MSQIPITVSVDEAHLPQIQEISQQLGSSGMNVEQTLSSIGVIQGSIAEDRVNIIREIEGVQNVETQRTYHLNPPDSKIQ